MIDGSSEDRVFTIDELSRYLRIAKSTLYKLAQERKLPGQKIGKHWRFRKATVDRWLEEVGPAEQSKDVAG